MATNYDGVAFGKVDVDDNAAAAEEFMITGVPTFVFYDGEEQVGRFSGADPNMLESSVKELDSK